MAVNTAGIDRLGIKQANRAGPEFVVLGRSGRLEQIDGGLGCDRVGIPRLADDPYETVLGDGARRPAAGDLVLEPASRPPVVNMLLVQ
jgi:hypothetical protein